MASEAKVEITYHGDDDYCSRCSDNNCRVLAGIIISALAVELDDGEIIGGQVCANVVDDQEIGIAQRPWEESECIFEPRVGGRLDLLVVFRGFALEGESCLAYDDVAAGCFWMFRRAGI